MLRDDQRQWIIDFFNDNHKTDRDKMTFIFHFIDRKKLMEDFAEHIGNNYGFACPHEEFENLIKKEACND